MYDPNGIGPIVEALRQPAGVQMAGELVPFDFSRGDLNRFEHTGPTNKATDYAWGKNKDPNVLSIGKEALMNWLRNYAGNIRGGGSLAPVGPLAPRTPGSGPLGVGPPGVPPYL